MYQDYLGLNSDYVYSAEYAQPVFAPVITNVLGGSVVTTINGASGPNINLASSVGFLFTGAPNGNITMSGTLLLANGGTGATSAVGARSNLGAAESGVNGDITMFTALSGSGGWQAWTGNSDKTTHATYTGTASVGYVQAELQGVMNKLQETTEALKALLDTLLGSGVIKL